MPATWTIRRARAEDAAALSAIAEATFRGTFGPDNTAEDMDLHCARYFTPEAQSRELADPAMENLVVEADGQGVDGSAAIAGFLGYAQVRRGPAPACVRGPDPIELQRIYVVPGLHGAGLAAALRDEVVRRAGELGARTLWLGVWERNPRAIRFYVKQGFREVGDQVFRLGRDPQRDLVLERDLAT